MRRRRPPGDGGGGGELTSEVLGLGVGVHGNDCQISVAASKKKTKINKYVEGDQKKREKKKEKR